MKTDEPSEAECRGWTKRVRQRGGNEQLVGLGVVVATVAVGVGLSHVAARRPCSAGLIGFRGGDVEAGSVQGDAALQARGEGHPRRHAASTAEAAIR